MDVFSRMSNKDKIKYIHITKTAGSTIEQIGIDNGIEWGICDTRMKNYPLKEPYASKGIVKHSFWHFPPKYFKENPYDGYTTFTVVRNPYERIVSEVFFLNREKFDKKNPMSLEFFNKSIKESIEQAMNDDIDHYLPQHYYTHSDNVQTVNDIIRFENIGPEFNALMKKYGLNLVLDRNHNAFGNKTFGVNDINKENMRLINEFYHNDFVLFGYSKISND